MEDQYIATTLSQSAIVVADTAIIIEIDTIRVQIDAAQVMETTIVATEDIILTITAATETEEAAADSALLTGGKFM